MRFLAVLVCGHCMLFGFIVSAVLMMMGSLPVMVRRLFMVRRSCVMMLACRMFRFCHRFLPDILRCQTARNSWHGIGAHWKASRTGEILCLLKREPVKLIHLQFRKFLY